VNPDGPVLGRARPVYELAERSRAVAHGGIGAVMAVAGAVGLAGEIDTGVQVLAQHRRYWESDHVLNIALNALCGGVRLKDIEARRGDAVFLDALGVDSLPDPTTAGDFCRRFDTTTTMALQEAINRARLRAWDAAGRSFLGRTARIDADASIVATGGETKAAMDIAYNGIQGSQRGERISSGVAGDLAGWSAVFDAVDESEVGSRVEGFGGGELDGEGGDGPAAAGCGERLEADVEFVADDLEVGGGGERLGEQAVGFVFGSGVVRPERGGQCRLCVPGGHAYGVMEALAFVVESHGVGADGPEGNSGGDGGAVGS